MSEHTADLFIKADEASSSEENQAGELSEEALEGVTGGAVDFFLKLHGPDE